MLSSNVASIEKVLSLEETREFWHKRITSARQSPDTFAETILPNQDDPTLKIVQADFHEDVHHALSTHDYLVVELPREHGKTEQIISRIVWELGLRPWLRIVIVCANNPEAKKRIAAIGQYINTPLVRMIFPWLMPAFKGQWSSNALFVQRFNPEAVKGIATREITPLDAYKEGLVIISKDPSIEARGILGSGTGSRADLIVYDDPCDFSNTIGRPGLRPIVRQAYADNWEQIVTKAGGRQWYVGTPWAEDDLLAHLKSIALPYGSEKAAKAERADWIHFGRPTGRGAAYGEPECLWPQRISVSVLNSAYTKIGSAAYARAYLLKPVSDEDRLFSEASLKKITPIDSSVIKYNPDGYPIWRRYGGLDLAVSTKDTADNRVLTTAILNPATGERILMGQRVGKWGATEISDVVIEEYIKWKWSVLRVENNAMQEAVRQWIGERVKQRINESNVIREKIERGEVDPDSVKERLLDSSMFINTEAHTTTAINKWDSAIGLPALAAEIEAGRWRVVLPADHEGGNFCRCWFCELLAEMRGFRRNGTSLAPHDDRVFSLWFTREAVVNNSSSIAPKVLGEDTRAIKHSQSGARKSVKVELRNW